MKNIRRVFRELWPKSGKIPNFGPPNLPLPFLLESLLSVCLVLAFRFTRNKLLYYEEGRVKERKLITLIYLINDQWKKSNSIWYKAVSMVSVGCISIDNVWLLFVLHVIIVIRRWGPLFISMCFEYMWNSLIIQFFLVKGYISSITTPFQVLVDMLTLTL